MGNLSYYFICFEIFGSSIYNNNYSNMIQRLLVNLEKWFHNFLGKVYFAPNLIFNKGISSIVLISIQMAWTCFEILDDQGP